MQHTDDLKEQERWLTEAANGNISAEDQARLDAAMADDPALADELAFSQLLASQTKAATTANVPESEIPGDFVWKRLQRSIQAEADGVEGSSSKTSASVSKLHTSDQREPRRWLGGLAIAACLMVMIQGGYIWSQLANNSDAGYGLAGGSSANQGEGPVLQVQFASDVTMGEIEGLLAGQQASIISGPSAIGLYRVQLPKALKAQDAVTEFRAAASVVHVAAEN